jgi:capsid protein
MRIRFLAVVMLACCIAAHTEGSDMSWLRSARDAMSRLFTSASGYDALTPAGRRRSVSSHIQPEDKVLTDARRRSLSANAMDLHRNVALASWAIRQHLNYVALFDFYASSKDRGLNKDLQDLIARDGRAANCDLGGRHPWWRLRRLCEVRKTLDGDCALIKLRSGHLQGIESHMIRTPGKVYPNSTWVQGVLLGAGNRAMAYNVRQTGGTDRMVSADNCHLFAAFEGRFDQVRGISSFSASMNEYRDLYESLDYARAKIKVEQLFALAITRDKEPDANAGSTLGRRINGDEDEEDDATEDTSEATTTQVDFGRGPVKLDLDPGEDAKFLTGSNPSQQTQDFLRLSIHIALLSLDIPMNFFDPKYVNYSGGRTSWNQYERSCVAKRDEQLELHDWYTRWRVARYLLPKSVGGTGELVLPRPMSVADLHWEWVSRGVPWWKPSEELDAELRSVAGGLDTPQKICRRHGMGDFFHNLDEIAEAMKAAEERGLKLQFGGQPSPFTIVTQTEDNA